MEREAEATARDPHVSAQMNPVAQICWCPAFAATCYSRQATTYCAARDFVGRRALLIVEELRVALRCSKRRSFRCSHY